MRAGNSSSASAPPSRTKYRGSPRAVVHPADVDAGLLAKLGPPLLREAHAFDLLRRPELAYDDLSHVAPGTEAAPGCDAWRGDERLAEQVKLQVDVQAKYSGYLQAPEPGNRARAAQR